MTRTSKNESFVSVAMIRQHCAVLIAISVHVFPTQLAFRRRKSAGRSPVFESPNTVENKSFCIFLFRSESNLFESTQHSADTRCSDIIVERQRQLQREMREMHDTLTRGLRLRHRLPTWDSMSTASWTSSIGSASRNRLRKYRVPIWDPLSGALPMWDNVSTDGSFTKSRSEEMISREESPKWYASSNRRNFYSIDEDESTPWETLEETLNKKLSKYTDHESDSLEIDGDVGIDYLLTTNARKAFPDLSSEKDSKI